MSAAAKHERQAILALLDERIAGLRDAPHVARELRELRHDIATAKHRTAPPPLEIVRRPVMVGNLPDAKKPAALAHVERIADQHRANGTEPTPVPKGAQR